VGKTLSTELLYKLLQLITRWSNQEGKIILTAGPFAQCPSFNHETTTKPQSTISDPPEEDLPNNNLAPSLI